jgi:hypothetical protein
LPSRLGDPAPQAPSGAARFAAPAPKSDAKALKRQNALTLKRQKQPVTIRLTPDAIDRLGELELSLRRAGVRARQASASEIVDALLRSTTAEAVRNLIGETVDEKPV